jgi:hypothetical protein
VGNGAFAVPSGDPDHWEIQISLYNSTSRDSQNAVGVDLSAQNALDAGDVLEPPALPGRLSLFVEFQDPGPLARDVGEPVVRSRSWMVTASNLKPGDTHFILVDGLESVPAEYQVLLIDYAGGIAQELHGNPQYLFSPTTLESQRSLEIRVYNPPPGQIGSVDTIPGLNSVTIIWGPSTDADVTGYTVYKGSSPGVYDSSYSLGDTNEFTLPGVEEGETLYFAVSAVDRSGLEGELSAEVKYPPDPVVPPDFDVDQNGVIDHVDLFTLAGSWRQSTSAITWSTGSTYEEVGPDMLTNFLSAWRTSRQAPAE